MTGWLENLPWLVIATIGGAWILAAFATGPIFTRALGRIPQTPAGGEPPVTPRAGEGSPLPGHIPPPPATHPGRVIRLAAVYECAHGHYGWVWRPGRGWHLQLECVPLPTPGQYDAWLAAGCPRHTGEDA